MRSFGGYISVAVFFAAIVAGVYSGSRSWDGVVYLTDGTIANNSRNPAAIKRELDFSRLDGAELIMATQKRLVTAAKVIVRQGLIGVELGHFVTRDSTGQRRLACDGTFNRLTLRFDADGMASAGEKPFMEIDAPCVPSSSDITSIEPIWIQVEKLLEGRAVDAEVNFSDGINYKFNHMNGSWPISWSLQSVRLYSSGKTEHNDETRHEVSISARELKEIRNRPFVMNWMEARRKPSAIDSTHLIEK